MTHRVCCGLSVVGLVMGFGLLAAGPAVAQSWKYPPGPPYRVCPDTLTVFQVQRSDTAQAPCHPAALDTVMGVRGVITALDQKATGYSFYIQNTFADGAHPWTGVMVFTGGTNYGKLVRGTPTGGFLARGDSVVVYGRTIEFLGETEIEGFDGVIATNDIVIRRIGSGVALPPAMIGSTATLHWDAAVSEATAEPWEGCLVRINGPLRVGLTSRPGLPPNSFLAFHPGNPADSVLIDGFTLTTMGLPPVGTDIDFVQGILNQRTTGGIASYRIQIRDADDISLQTAPHLIDAYALESHRLRLVFDYNLDPTTATNATNYSLASLGSVNTATLVGGAGPVVELDITSPLSAGAGEVVTASGIGSAACPGCLSAPQARSFLHGVLSAAEVQAPDPASLTPSCEDRSRFAGTGSLPGPRITVRGVEVQNHGSVFYLADAAGGARSGLAVFAPTTELAPGRQYRVVGAIQEFLGETEITNVVDVQDEGAASFPGPVLVPVAQLRDVTCDSNQNLTTGEDFEGRLVRAAKVRVVLNNTAPFDPPAGGSFRVVQPVGAGAPDTIRVSNFGGHFTYDPEAGQVLSVAGLLRPTTGAFEILPRGDTDITFLSAIQPAAGGGSSSVSPVITGHGFLSGVTVRLSKSGEPDVIGSNILVAPDGRSLVTTLDLQGRAVGAWDVIVTFPGSHADTLEQAFSVEGVVAPQLRVTLVGLSVQGGGPAPGDNLDPLPLTPEQSLVIRQNRRTALDLVIQNPGNVDAQYVPLWLAGIPWDATVELDFPLGYPAQAGGEPSWGAAGLPFHFTSAAGSKYVPLVIPRVPPGTTTRRVWLTVPGPSHPPFQLSVGTTPPWVDGAVFRSCMTGAGVTLNAPCAATQLTGINATIAANPQIPAFSGVAVWAKVGWQCEGAAGSLPTALARAEQVLDHLVGPVEGGSVASGCENVFAPQWRQVLAVTVVTTVNANDKLGAVGTVSGNQALPYSIRFENLASSGGPAQTVVVTDQLDANVLDLSTLSLDQISFGSVTLYPPPGLKNYSTTVDLRPTTNLLVGVAVSLDPFTNVLAWYFNSIDPVTGQPPSNAAVGFLPPNLTPPQGEGSVLFTVLPKAGILTGTTVANAASILFDDPPTMTTPAWSNGVDNTPPTSHVLPLSATSNGPSIPVSWVADGNPPDLRDFTIYVKEDAGPYRVWRLNTPVTSDTLVPPQNRQMHTYSFYSVARDQSGNIETSPVTSDATTQSTTGVGEPAPFRLALEGGWPNPARGEIRAAFTLPAAEPATLELIDIAGRRVARREVGTLGPGSHRLTLSAPRGSRPGIYFLRLVQGSHVLHARVALIR